MTTAGRYIAIRIDRNAFEEFFKEKAPGSTRRSIAAKAGFTENTLYVGLKQQQLSLQSIEKIAKAFDITMWNLPFVNDEAYTISFKLTTNLDLHLRAKMIDQIRGLLANGIPQDKVRNIVLSDILVGKYKRSTQSDSESKACLASTSVLVEPEPSEISESQSELSEAKDRIAYMERTLSDSEQIEAKNLAQAIVAYLKSCSEDKCSYIDSSMSGVQWEYRTDVMKIHAKWSAIHKSCELLDISVKERPLLDTVCFFITNDTWSTTSDAKHVDNIKRRLYEEVEFIGRYPIKANTDVEEETENERT